MMGDGFGGGVIDVELLCDLKYITRLYIDDAPPFLNAVDQFLTGFLAHLLVLL